MPDAKTQRHHRAALTVTLTLVVALTSGCATLFNPTTQNIPVTTHPDGGEVWVDGKFIGTAPLTLELDTNKRHDVTVRRGDIIRTWQMKPHLSTRGASYLGYDAVVLVPATFCAVKAFEGAAFYRSHSSFVFDQRTDTFMGVSCLAIGLTPLVVDVTTNHLNELQPTEITVDFR